MHRTVMNGSLSNIQHLQRSELSDSAILLYIRVYGNLTTKGTLGLALMPELSKKLAYLL
jgi:hypothetical protein